MSGTARGNSIFRDLPTTIFTVMSTLAQEHGAVNLGQGFPEGLEPVDLLDEAARLVREGPHQYPPMMGVPELRQAVAEHERRFYGLDVDWRTQVMVTSGATEALADCLFGMIEPGDRVVLFEPLYDSYLPIVRRAGGVPVVLRLQPPEWAVPRGDLERAFAEGARLVLLNSPANPTGKVWSDEDLSFLAELLLRHDGIAICDEVYEHLVFDGRAHRPLMTLPGMADRCLRIGSAGKTFSITSWKVGYVIGAPDLLAPVSKAHQFVTFTTPTGLQRAVASGLARGDGYYQDLATDMQSRRDRLAEALTRLGLDVLPCGGTYFLVADFRPLGFNGDDVAFCRWLTTEAGVAAIPCSAFYAAEPPGHLARFCFAKTDAQLGEAIDRMARALPRIRGAG